MSLFAGIDMGTRDVRCLIVDSHGEPVSAGHRTWREGRARGNLIEPPEPGIDEVNVDGVRDALADSIREALSGCDPSQLDAIGIASQRSGVVFVDEHGEVIQAGSNADARALVQGIQQQREHGDAIYRIAGRLPAILYLPARLAWLRANRPEDCDRIRWALSLGDWLAFELSGVAATEPMQAAEHLVFDVGARAWSAELLDALEVPRTILPRLVRTGETSGAVTAAAAERYGIPGGVRVVPAGTDTQTTLLGLGVVEPGQAAVVAGTTMLASRVLDTPGSDPERRLWLSPHASADGWVHEAHCGESGPPIEWMAALMGADAAGLATDAENGEPGAAGLVFVDAAPVPAGDFVLIRRAGLSMPAPLLALGRPRADVARAVFEGTAYGACVGLRWLTEQHGEPSSISIGGGVARSHVFRSVIAGVTERPVRVSARPETSALGAAIVAAAEVHGDVRAAVEVMADACDTIEPDPSLGYPAHFAAWAQHAAAFDVGAIRLGDLM